MARPFRRFLFGALVAAALVAGFLFWPPPVPRTTGPIPHEAYVWQRGWTSGVREAVAGAAPTLGALVALGAEVAWDDGKPRVVRVRVSHEALRKSGLPVGLALRIGSFSGPFSTEGEPFETIAGLAESLVRASTEAGVPPRELQLDFDCAESKLDGYRVWVGGLRRRLATVPVTFTALPSWLDGSAFRRLARAANGFVIQVHSFERPRGADADLSLCKPVAARRAVERAARAGVPFRVALPTYGYLVGFDRSGKYLGLSAEGPRPKWPADATLREVSADPAAMAELVRGWTTDRPEMLRGIIWYRLPVSADVLNWRWKTLRAVREGRTPCPALRAEVRRTKPGLVEVDLVNDGDADAPLPGVTVTLRWRGARRVASDPLNGFTLKTGGAGALSFHGPPPAPLARLRAGERKQVGWVRLDGNPGGVETAVQVGQDGGGGS
jgi:hypothetical protein